MPVFEGKCSLKETVGLGFPFGGLALQIRNRPLRETLMPSVTRTRKLYGPKQRRWNLRKAVREIVMFAYVKTTRLIKAVINPGLLPNSTESRA
jgi:hypothetical protein